MRSESVRRCSILALFIALAVWCVGGLSACNTVEGAGEDIEDAGDSIQDAAD